MKGNAFKYISELIIALFAVAIFLVIIQSMSPGVKGNSYCKIGNAISSLPVPDSLKPSLDGCTFEVESGRVTIEAPLDERTLSEYVLSCWDEGEHGISGQTYTCYEIFARNVSRTIDEISFTDYLTQQDLCGTLPNNYLEDLGIAYSCGETNNLFWRIGDIYGEDQTILIKYNSFDHRVEVI